MLPNIYLKIHLIVLFYAIEFFNNYILAEKLFAKALWSLGSCVLFTLVPFFIPDFNLLICESYNFIFKVLYWVILYWSQKKNTFTVPCEESKTVSFASSIMKNITAFFSRFLVKLICFIAFG